MKTCKTCKQEKGATEFYKGRASCKPCVRVSVLAYYQQNKESRKAKMRAWQTENKSQVRAYYRKHREKYRERARKYRESHPEYASAYACQRRKDDHVYKLKCRLRCRVYGALRGKAKTGSAVRDLGCSVEALKQHLESLFQDGMSWENWSRYGWHVDHIVPLAWFDLSDPEEWKRACHYTNLQPLWAIDNHRKRDYIA